MNRVLQGGAAGTEASAGTAGHVAVIDIGKTNAKLALVDLADLSELAVVTRPNTVLAGPPWPHFDVEGHWAFLLDALARFQSEHGVDAISITTHGACAALLGADGRLAAPILDYEHDGPDALAADYDALRPDFAETGSPRLGMGLNIGAQLHWQFAQDAGLKDRTATILTYPQYWGFRLTGVAATDVTSLGCHTDLWAPGQGGFSSLVDRLGIAGKIAPARASGDVLGPVLPEIAQATGLAPGTPVHCGIHDSNASLLPHLMGHDTPFSVVSTGTWVIAMSVGGRPVTLDPALDTLINVNAFGQPVPSARFMGGREHDMIMGGAYPEPGAADIDAVLDGHVMLLPAVVPETGPFTGRQARWLPSEPQGGQRAAALGFYLALVTARCLALIGHDGPIIVEGPFARNGCFRRMLAAATGGEVLAMKGATGTSQGAALLAGPDRVMPAEALRDAPPAGADAERMQRYVAAWTAALG
ncbi:FGGY-family carbohydrate kinase [Marinibacterium sp. SX1]|uniref:FGGY-family carbohydrate kinase n=1 Tax=Marinibacterium sp. SX1 TaxID=3388424 RepID=UPI003D16F40B